MLVILLMFQIAVAQEGDDFLIRLPNGRSIMLPWKNCSDCRHPQCNGFCPTSASHRCMKIVITKKRCSCQLAKNAIQSRRLRQVNSPHLNAQDLSRSTYQVSSESFPKSHSHSRILGESTPASRARLLTGFLPSTSNLPQELTPEQEIKFFEIEQAKKETVSRTSTSVGGSGAMTATSLDVTRSIKSYNFEAPDSPSKQVRRQMCYECVVPNCNATCPSQYDCKPSSAKVIANSICRCLKLERAASSGWVGGRYPPRDITGIDADVILELEEARSLGLDVSD